MSDQKSVSTGVGRYIFIAAIMTLVVNLAAGAGLGWLQFVKQYESEQIRIANEVARQNSVLISTVVKRSEAVVDHFAQSPALQNALTAGNEASLASILNATLPETKMVIVSVNDQAPDFLSFTARDMVSKVRKGQQVPSIFLPGQVPRLLTVRQHASGAIVVIEQQQQALKSLIAQQQITDTSVQVLTADGHVLFNAGVPVSGQQAEKPSAAGTIIKTIVAKREVDNDLLVFFLSIGIAMVLLVTLIVIITIRAIGWKLKKDAALLSNLAHDLQEDEKASAQGEFTFESLALVSNAMRALVGSSVRPSKRRADSEETAFAFTESRGGEAVTAEDEEQGDDFLDEAPQAPPEEDPMPDLAADEPAYSEEEVTQMTAALDAELTGTEKSVDLDVDASSTQEEIVKAEIFRAYDIRGTVGKTLSTDVAKLIGRAVGSTSIEAGTAKILVARDGRLSSPELTSALIEGLLACGCDVIDLDAIPTPLLYGATKTLDVPNAVMVTGSHNPPADNGFKIIINNETLHGESIQALRQRIAANRFIDGQGSSHDHNVTGDYIQAVLQDIVMARPMKLVIDTGNGITGFLAPNLFRQLGCEVKTLFEQVDGNFPNHTPDTSKPENYQALIDAMKAGDGELGIAFDGDGDRVGVVTPSGEIIWPDRLMMLFAKDLLTRSPGEDVLFDVKCSRELARLISQQGGRPVMTATGHSLVKAKMRETGAPLAGEMSGHIFFADRWNGFDDGLYAAARLLEILSLESGTADDVFAEFTTGVSTPEISIPVPDKAKFGVIEKLQAMQASFDGTVITLDGLRVDYEDGWGLVRASNTTPSLVARFEGVDQQALTRIQDEFKKALTMVSAEIRLPF